MEKLALTENGRSSRASVNGDSASVRGRSPGMSSSASVFGDDGPAPFHSGKGMRQEGQRNLQDSTFSISGTSGDVQQFYLLPWLMMFTCTLWFFFSNQICLWLWQNVWSTLDSIMATDFFKLLSFLKGGSLLLIITKYYYKNFNIR
jgi:hypothetical protein